MADKIYNSGPGAVSPSPVQLAAIHHIRGPAMVIAGPGSGKTTVITERIRYLIESAGIPPSSILVITFTRASANEMQQRFLKLTDHAYPEVLFGTFHSVFYSIIKDSCPDRRNISLADVSVRMRIIENILCRRGLEYSQDIIKLILSDISRFKNSGTDCSPGSLDTPYPEHFSGILKEYDKTLKCLDLIDFDDILLICKNILENDPHIFDMFQRKFCYILIDEFQDINRIQFDVIRLLSRPEDNIFVVGDDDQSIYGFRGSDPLLMKEFERVYDNCRRFILGENHRCARMILKAASAVIKDNSGRFDKELSVPDHAKDGRIISKSFGSRSAQYEYIARSLEKLTPADLSETAVLFRTGSEAAAMMQVLVSHRIPADYNEKIEDLYDKKPVRELMSYLLFAMDGQKRSDYYRIMNRPLRFLSRESAQNETVKREDVMSYYRNDRNMSRRASLFFSQIDMISRMRPHLAVRYIRTVIGLDRVYKDEQASGNISAGKALALMDSFEEICREHGNISSLKKHIEEYRLAIAAGNRKRDRNGVKIMTMHGSKGLEFDRVYIPDLNEGILPSRRAVTVSQIEEERRMLYVSMTRARNELFLSYVKGTQGNEVLPTRFIRNIRYLF